MQSNIPIYFYLPRKKWPFQQLPKSISSEFISSLNEYFFTDTSLNWSLQTFVRLKHFGVNCELIDYIPAEGIFFATRADIPFHFKPPKKLLFISMLGDASPHPFAQCQIVQNPVLCKNKRFGKSYFMPHWPQQGIKPRNKDRGLLIENIAFYGDPVNLAKELKDEAWYNFLISHGLKWQVYDAGSPKKLDYSQTDLIIAIRSFEVKNYDNKPASKLYNAWQARVPAILGNESAFRAERKNHFDYIEVSSFDELCSVLVKLKSDTEYLSKMINNSEMRSSEITVDNIIMKWIQLINLNLISDLYKWLDYSSVKRQYYHLNRLINIKKQSLSYLFTHTQN